MTIAIEPPQARLIRAHLYALRRYQRALARRGDHESRAELAETAEAISALLPANDMHDAGAYAMCGYCGRYTVAPAAVSSPAFLVCDCGRVDWQHRFPAVDDETVWAMHLE